MDTFSLDWFCLELMLKEDCIFFDQEPELDAWLVWLETLEEEKLKIVNIKEGTK